MGSIRSTIVTMLAALALAAFAPDADAHARRSSDVNKSTPARQSTARTSAQARRSSQAAQSDDNKKSSVRRPSTTVATPSGKGTTSSMKPAVKPGSDKPVQITRPAPRKPQVNNQSDRPGVRPDARPDRPGKPGMGPGYAPAPPGVHPRDRDFMRWDKPSYWWSYDAHYYGHKVRMLPSHAHKHVYHGVTYYCHNDIWYRPYGGHYVVCRPPYGLSIAAEIISDLAWAAVRMSYYNAMADAYSQSAYALANRLNLTQNYASADSDYFYQDGVFYSKDVRGEYRIILPPSGALVEYLPDDFDLITLSDGNEYYKVDDTIYKLKIVDGKPYFEVVGQM